MKPPTRSRSKPPRFVQGTTDAGTEPTAPTPERRHRRVLHWTPAQRQRLLNALKALGRTSDAGSAPLDYTALQTRMPKTPVNEIKCMVEALQNKVLSHVSYGLREENREEQRLNTPIELWVEQACRVTGALEEPILRAFSQMFSISSMEPGSQQSTHPTHVPLTSTVPPPRSPAPHPLTSTVPPPRSPAPHPLTSTVPPPRSPAPHPLTSTVPPPRSPAPHPLTSTVPPPRSPAPHPLTSTVPPPRSPAPHPLTSTVPPPRSPAPHPLTSTEPPPRSPAPHPLTSTVPPPRSPAPHPLTSTVPPPRSPAPHPLTSTSSPSRSLAGGRTVNLTPTPCGSDSPGQQSSCAASPTLVPTRRTPGPPQTTGTPDPPHSTTLRTPGPPQTLQSQTPMGGPLNQTTGSSRLRSYQARRCHNVDFSKIYSYLGEVDSEKKDRCVLTAMESAVVLELLMCLPEELHLLDGSELHRHFMEVYEVLSSPASSIKSQMFSVKAERSKRPAAPSGGQTTHSTSTAHPEKNADTATPVESPSNRVGRGGATNSKGRDQDMMSSSTTNTTTPPTCQSSSTQTEITNLGPSDWERAGLCPLNPFRVPLKLLARHT